MKYIALFLLTTASLSLASCSKCSKEDKPCASCVCHEKCGCKEETPHESHQCTAKCDPWHK